jgi:hypothetical protein
MNEIVFSEDNRLGKLIVRLAISVSKQEKLVVMNFSDNINYFAMNKELTLQLISDLNKAISELSEKQVIYTDHVAVEQDLDNINDWDEYDSKSPLKMGLKNPKGYSWCPEQDQGDGGSSFFKLFRLKPWSLVLSVYPSYILTKDSSGCEEYAIGGVEVVLADRTRIFKAKLIKDVNWFVIKYCKKNKP